MIMKVRNYLFIFAVFLAIACKKAPESIKPQKKDIVQVVYASGKVYPKNQYNVFSKMPGYIVKIHVKVGDIVQEGQPLISIQSQTNEKTTAIAKNQLEWAFFNQSENAPLIQAQKKELQAAWEKYLLDSLNYQRQASLIHEKATTTFQYDQAKTQWEISKSNYQKAQLQLEQTQKQLALEYKNAKLQYEAQQSNLSDYVIRSAVQGKVYDVISKEGELVGPTSLLMVIGDANNFEAELQVDETDIALLKKGQSLFYQLDAYPNQNIYGQILEIYPRINPTNKTCRIFASIHDTQHAFFAGQSIEANILIQEKKQAIVIPKNFLWNEQFVITTQKDTLKVQKGIEDLEYVEILSGISLDKEILKP